MTDAQQVNQAPQTKPTKPKKPYEFKQLLLDLHLWLGLISGLIVFILCLTGTVLVIQEPVERWANQNVLQVTPGPERLPLETLIPQVAVQTGQEFTGLMIPHDASQAIMLQKGRAPGVYVNPYSGEVLGGINQGLRDGFMVFFRLHRWLLLDSEIGRPITGAATLMFIVILVSGLVLWMFKARPRPARSLMFKRGVSWKRLNYDLHVIFGFYTFLPLLVMSLTALYWSYNPQFETSVYRLLDNQPAPAEEPEARPESNDDKKPKPLLSLPYAHLQAEATRLYPYAGDLQIRFPMGKPGDKPVTVTKTHNPTSLSIPYRDGFTADAVTGTVIEQTPFASKTRAEKMLSLVKAIHVGTIFGSASFWIYLLACLIATSLPLTGVIHWALKLKASRRARARKATAAGKPQSANEPEPDPEAVEIGV